MRPKPRGLDPSYAAQFSDPSVVAAYPVRPPYSSDAVAFLADLAGGRQGRLLDLGCGTGELTRRLAPQLRFITAVDRSEEMIAKARMLPGGHASNVRWVTAPVEDIEVPAGVTLVLAAESFHWFDWPAVCAPLTRFAPAAPLVLVDRCELTSPWSTPLRTLIASSSTNVDFEPYDLIQELESRGYYAVRGQRAFGPEVIRQSVADYVLSLHSRNGLSRDRMAGAAVQQFDEAVRALVQAHAGQDMLDLRVETRVIWGDVMKPPEVSTRRPESEMR